MVPIRARGATHPATGSRSPGPQRSNGVDSRGAGASVGKKVAGIAAGIGAALGGVAVSAGSGLAAAAMDIRAHKFRSVAGAAERRAFKIWGKRPAQAHRYMRISEDLIQRGVRAGKLGTHIGSVGKLAGTAMIGYGINRILRETPAKDNPEARGAASTVAAFAATHSLQGVYMTRFYRDVSGMGAIRKALSLAIGKGKRLF